MMSPHRTNQKDLGSASDQVQAGISAITMISTLVGYAIISTVFMYSTFATQREIDNRAASRVIEMADLKDRLNRMDGKLDTIILQMKEK